ncbi:hypothetical protein [Mycobacterium sp. NPDC050041]|uniref:hypothetical protein n=1 Tax=Mycobacterium sp. NPDC050041 TaxID=3364293 RepID=UPI003C2BDBBA
MKVASPVATLGAVAALGAGLFLVNMSKEEPPAAPATASVTAPAAAPSAPASPQPAPPGRAFPAKADYVGEIPTRSGVLTLDIAVDGQKAVGYACDNYTVETWLEGSAANGMVTLWDKDRTSRLDGRLEGSAVAGTLRIGESTWAFTATRVGGATDDY